MVATRFHQEYGNISETTEMVDYIQMEVSRYGCVFIATRTVIIIIIIIIIIPG